MKRHTAWNSLILIGLLGLPLITFAEECKWTKKSAMLTARAWLSTSVVNGKIYAIGGSLDGHIPLSAVEEYDPVTDRWTKKSDMPTARASLSTSVVNEKIYAIGGEVLMPWGQHISVSTVEEYDPATDKWTKKADMSVAKTACATSVANGKIYAIGGFLIVGGGLLLAEMVASLPKVDEYDPRTDRWTVKSEMSKARASLSTNTVNGKIYAIGGEVGFGETALSNVEEYNPLSDKWTKKADIPTARASLSTSAINGKIYAIGGLSDGRIPLSTVDEYDPKTDRWTKKADMPTARASLSTSAVNGKIYAIGGLSDGSVSLSIVEEYDTGFAGEAVSIEAKGKLITTWSKIKAKY